MEKRIKFFYRWYDFYIGLYYDQFKKYLYVVIFGLVVRIRVKSKYTRQDTINYREHRLDEMIEDIGDKLGIYEGQYNRDEEDRERNWHKPDCCCRLCFSIEMKDKFRQYLINNP